MKKQQAKKTESKPQEKPIKKLFTEEDQKKLREKLIALGYLD